MPNPPTKLGIDRSPSTIEAYRADYVEAVQSIEHLHEEGELLGRVANLEEARVIVDHAPGSSMVSNDILSTTLLPRKNSSLEVRLFGEYHDGSELVGILLDPHRASETDFGRAFNQNACTVGSGFSQHKQARKDGATTWRAQKQLLRDLEERSKEGYNVNHLHVSLNPQHPDKWDITLPQIHARKETGEANDQAPHQAVYWNEMTFYRGIEGDLFVGFFIKSNSASFSKELKHLFELQERICRHTGRLIPIFKLNGAQNQLTEIPPEPLLLGLVGANDVDLSRLVAEERPSQLTRALEAARINSKLALDMNRELPKSGPIRTLFELQLLLFNISDITGNINIAETKPSPHNPHSTYSEDRSIRVIDNLHLVFPTIHQTNNSGEHVHLREAYFRAEQVQEIYQKPALQTYLALALIENFKRFLGIHIDPSNGQITFDPAILQRFDLSDTKRSDFAKVLARALQAAMLFNIFGNQTEAIVQRIASSVRKTLPFLGVLPTGEDMILGSPEMQEIINLRNDSRIQPSIGRITQNLTFRKATSDQFKEVSIPRFPFDPSHINPFSQEGVNLPTREAIIQYLTDHYGITDQGINPDTLSKALHAKNPFQPERYLIEALCWLQVIDPSAARKILQEIKTTYPTFGRSADGKSLTETGQDIAPLTRWIDEQKTKKPPTAEFPFSLMAKMNAPEETQSASSPAQPNFVRGGGRRGISAPPTPSPMPMGRRAAVRFGGSISSASPAAPPRQNLSALYDANYPLLVQNLDRLLQWQGAHDSRYKAATELQMFDSAKGQWIWAAQPTFHDAGKEKPTAPYLSVKDLLGQHVVSLMTGPAMAPKTVDTDQQTVTIYYDTRLVPSTAAVQAGTFDRYLTHTLAVTTDGDKQVIRPNGTQYDADRRPPAGGGIEFHAGNERFDFRRTQPRHYHNRPNSLGAYSDQQLDTVQSYDAHLLSDEERRLKSASLLLAGYITITAKGGFQSERVALDRGYRVLFLNTAGAQFEKYQRGEFVSRDGSRRDTNELEASDFIIKMGAPENPTPLFPHYYQDQKIPAWALIAPGEIALLDGKDWNTPYARLKDGAYFNRRAFEVATIAKIEQQILPAIAHQCGRNKPYYLKATLFGGGFFATAGQAGSLREEVIHAILKGYTFALIHGLIPKGSVIEFPRYGRWADIDSDLRDRLSEAAQKQGVAIVWAEEGDLCDFSPQTALTGDTIDPTSFEQGGRLVLLNAGDAMSWVGNEASSASVEAMIGNNSNLRVVFNWWANPYLLSSNPVPFPNLSSS